MRNRYLCINLIYEKYLYKDYKPYDMEKNDYTIRKVTVLGGSIGISIPPGNGFVLGDHVKIFFENERMIVEKVEG